MAAEAAIGTYLKDVIGLGANILGTTRANAIIAEGLERIGREVNATTPSWCFYVTIPCWKSVYTVILI